MSMMPGPVARDHAEPLPEPPLYSLKVDSPAGDADGLGAGEEDVCIAEGRRAPLPSGLSLRRLDQYLSRHFQQTAALLRQSQVCLYTGCLLLGCVVLAVCLPGVPPLAGWMLIAAATLALLNSLAQAFLYRRLVRRSARAIAAVERVSAMIAGLEALDRLEKKDRASPAEELIRRMFASRPVATVKRRYQYRR